jgi:hypothetical protein
MFGINYDPAFDLLPLAAPGWEEPGSEASPPPPLTPPPAWIGPPRDGEACAFSGLARATFQTKVLGSFSKSLVHVSLRQRGADRGKQLVFAPSLHQLFLWTGGHPGELPTSPPDFRAAKLAPIPRRWIRAPKNEEHCGFCSLGHYSFYALLDEAGPAIQTAQLRLPSETRASRLVWLPSLHSYLVAKAEKQFTQITSH